MNQLKETQQMLIEMFSFFHDFCEKHSLKYYAVAGTALGAARHQGFIPWDDDIDIGMPRPDYERLIAIFNQQNTNKRYVLESPNSVDPLYPYPFTKIYDTQTTLIEKIRKPITRGIYLDILPLDGAGCEINNSRRLIAFINFCITIQRILTVDPNDQKERSFIKKITLILLYRISLLFFSYKKIRKIIDQKCKTFDYDSSKYITSYTAGFGKRTMVLKTTLGIPTLLKFENTQMYCPQEIDVYLQHLYGNWKIPPPKEKQITHHTYYLDLHKPYLKNK